MRPLIVAISLLTLMFATHDAGAKQSEEASTRSERAEEAAKGITDIKAFLQDIDNSVRLAGEGAYGRMNNRKIARLETARDKIFELLEGRNSTSELEPDERLEFFNAQETILSAVGQEDDKRIVCKRVASMGTKVTKTVCMTEGERKLRAGQAKDTADNLQRLNCIPGEGNPCAKF